jgi:Fe-S-cluster containining protein
VKRAIRKRAGKLRDKAAKSLGKLRGEDLQAVSNRQSQEQYIATLDHFVEAKDQSLPELAARLAVELVQETERLEQELVPQFIRQDQLAEIKCGAGCAWCCHEPLQVSILDAVSVAHHIRQGEEEFALEAYLEHLEPTENRRELLKESFEPCPFLGEDQRCRVYHARPVICRAFHSRDAEHCESLVREEAEQREVPMYTGLFGFRGLRLSGARKALRDLGFDDRPVVLAHAVKLLLDDFEGTTEAWLQGDDVFEPAVVR